MGGCHNYGPFLDPIIIRPLDHNFDNHPYEGQPLLDIWVLIAMEQEHSPQTYMKNPSRLVSETQ